MVVQGKAARVILLAGVARLAHHQRPPNTRAVQGHSESKATWANSHTLPQAASPAFLNFFGSVHMTTASRHWPTAASTAPPCPLVSSAHQSPLSLWAGCWFAQPHSSRPVLPIMPPGLGFVHPVGAPQIPDGTPATSAAMCVTAARVHAATIHTQFLRGCHACWLSLAVCIASPIAQSTSASLPSLASKTIACREQQLWSLSMHFECACVQSMCTQKLRDKARATVLSMSCSRCFPAAVDLMLSSGTDTAGRARLAETLPCAALRPWNAPASSMGG